MMWWNQGRKKKSKRDDKTKLFGGRSDLNECEEFYLAAMSGEYKNGMDLPSPHFRTLLNSHRYEDCTAEYFVYESFRSEGNLALQALRKRIILGGK